MPKLEEGNLWIRATLPQDVSFEIGVRKLAHEVREILLKYPEVTQVVSQMGRPDDGTDVTTFNNVEFMVNLKNPRPVALRHSPKTSSSLRWTRSSQVSRRRFQLLAEHSGQRRGSHVRRERRKLAEVFGDDIDTLVEKAGEVRDIMAQVPGIADLGVFPETGQPELLISINRGASGRYGLMAADVNAAVQAAIGGLAPTEILEGDRRFDFVIRYKPQYRATPEAIGKILLPTPDGNHVPLGDVADVSLKEGAFMIYRENGRRYIPVKFSVRGRDLASTIGDAQTRIRAKVRLPQGYHYEWAGEYESLREEERRLLVVIPITFL